ncbi:aspartyl-phosphate phosphatase Spo0E family protein [Paenibacillus sp. LPE1-1-1.1]|uniref:aspartyl-phosphate phosphatase Spo0E family protein n=1 Tax=Paenibacillus sp. LPE1-1-1.1 TaxID=3135230 RepID=UPI003414DBD5
MSDLKAVRTELEAKRKQMIESGIRLGLSHLETLKLSQEVDELHNEHMRIQRSKKQLSNVLLPKRNFMGGVGWWSGITVHWMYKGVFVRGRIGLPKPAKGTIAAMRMRFSLMQLYVSKTIYKGRGD